MVRAMTHGKEIDSPYAWFRLGVSMLISTIGGVGMWSVVVSLPAVQADFGIARGAASVPFTLTMIGFGVGGVLMGRISDRIGIAIPVAIGGAAMAIGYTAAAFTHDVWSFGIPYALFAGMLGTGSSFAPLMADISHWFEKRRGVAVSLCAAGNYLSGAIWPTVVEHLIRGYGWRTAYIAIGLFCAATMIPLALLLRAPAPSHKAGTVAAPTGQARTPFALEGLSPKMLQRLLMAAGLFCCVAMSMPQVHIVAYCGDLGYGVARGAEMLSLMLGCGIISRVASGFVADKLGGMKTMLIGSVMQMTALWLYLWMDGLTSLYIVSALFGLFQGGLVPSYAIVIRECFPAKEAGARVGVVMMMTLLGMALGGWMSGAIFDATGSYRAAFANGVVWNAGNVAIVVFLLLRRGRFVAPMRGIPNRVGNA
jgi:MFS family permease